jgi:dolichol-phosphate mannosyltransferase
MSAKIALTLLAFSLARLILASLFPLSADESYYWLWSKHLDFSYVDHPPLIAYLNFLATLGKENLFALRLGAAVITFLVSGLIFLMVKEIRGEKTAFWSSVLFQILPHFTIVWLTMFVELPLALFWTAALWIFSRVVKTRQSFWWYWLAPVVGLGFLSKYTMFLFWPALIVFFILSPGNRFWLRKKEPYLCFALSLLFFLPVLYWNSRHQWLSFAFHGARLAAAGGGGNFLAFLGDQLVHFSPFLLFSFPAVFRYALKKDDFSKLLFSFSFPILIFFLLLSLKTKVWAHWSAIGYLAALPLTVDYLLKKGKSLKKFMLWVSLFTLLLLTILFWISPGVLLHTKDYAQNRLLAKITPEYKLFAQTNVSAALLEFYLKRPAYLATGFLKIGRPWGEKQYELWGVPNLRKGETVLYYGEDQPSLREKAGAHFEKITPLPEVRLALVEDYIQHNYRMFKLENYRGGDYHP